MIGAVSSPAGSLVIKAVGFKMLDKTDHLTGDGCTEQNWDSKEYCYYLSLIE
jgi:hypothetical protein